MKTQCYAGRSPERQNHSLAFHSCVLASALYCARACSAYSSAISSRLSDMSELPCSHCGDFLLFQSVAADRPFCLNAKCVTNHMTLNPVLQQIKTSFECDPTQLDSPSPHVSVTQYGRGARWIDASQAAHCADKQDASLDAGSKPNVTENLARGSIQLWSPKRNCDKMLADKDPIENSAPAAGASSSAKTSSRAARGGRRRGR